MTTIRAAAVAALLFIVMASPVRAETPTAGASAQAEQTARAIGALGWRPGPTMATLPGNATIHVPKDEMWLDSAGTSRFLALTGNLPEDGLIAIAATDLRWFAILGFDPAGYVTDKEKIDPDKLLSSLRDRQAETNRARRDKGLDALELAGWTVTPHYDSASHNLEWGTRLVSAHGETVNYTTRLLGRRGVTSATLVSDRTTLAADLPRFRSALAGFAYAPGDRYEAYTKGDKVAEYGLAALITGGAAAAVLKAGAAKGLWALLVPFWKLIVAGAVAVAAWGRRIWSKLRGGDEA